MCWWCCMRVLEKCLPRNDIVRELAPYLQHVHQEDALDEDPRRGGEQGGPWVRSQSPRGLDKDSATSSDSLRHVNANYPLRHSLDCELSLQQQDVVGMNPTRPLGKMSVKKPDGGNIQDGGNYSDYATASVQKEQLASNEIAATQDGLRPVRTQGNSQKQDRENITLLRLTRLEAESGGGSSTQSGEVSGSEYSGVGSNGTILGKKSAVNKIKTDLGDLTPVRWEKVVIVQVSVQGFREMMTQAKDLMEDAKLLYEHTVLSRLASEYGGQEILSHSRSGLFVIAFASEFHAAKWCLSLQLSLVYAAWNDKLLKQFEDMREVSVTTNGKTKKNMLLYRGFRVRMVIHTADPDISPELSLCEAVKWTQTVSEYAHGGQIILSDNVWDRLKEQLVQLGNPVVEDLGCHAVLGDEVLLMLLLPRDLELRRFPSLNSPHQLSLGMRDAPSAQKPVTMVFTFIEGARPLVRCHAEELADRIKTLCMVARELLRKHNGYECQELQGDFMLAFFTPASAILWCGEFQLRIRQKFREWNMENENQELRFSMSMGIETGVPASVSPHKTSGRADYFGNIVNQTARIAKAAHGGQVLIGGDAWSAFCAAQSVCSSQQIITKTEKIKDVPGSTVFQFKAHGYYSFKGISKPIGLIEAIPIDVQSPMLSLELVTLVRGRAPKSKRIEDAALTNQAKTAVPDVPLELVRLSHGGEQPNNSIRETEFDFNLSWDDSIFVFEDIDEEDGETEGEGHSRGSANQMVCGSVALAMRNSQLNHSQLMALIRSSNTDGSNTPSQRSSATPTRTEDMDRV
ncbi:adenylate guanylate cyclase domain-containing protein [Phytophthora cinnamomi]|uniref:adenylate guanylate cyclase domain-containing protein n=1 Tax=Phytophthora cinnamomi TaxID=4785 RepID=UPI0035597BDD|nr:adenylate guanylate cyclase domain-containing protein [Phytophthora cinnamomi]